MKQLYLLVSMVLLVHVGAMAQRNELSASGTSTKQNSNVRLSDQTVLGVTGRVTDETGAAFPGVNVLVKGSSSGQTTDADGKYSIEVPDANSVLIFSFVGYATQEISVGSRTNIDVKLALDVQALNEVVVTALGIAKESKKLGYSATTAKVDEMTSNRTNNMMSSLEGKIAGLDISPPTAGPASSNKIRIRGQSAFAGSDNGPLLVINGLPMSQGAESANGGQRDRDGGDNFMLFNPDDVESMTVLKGATAAALYGSRAAAGAIIITTKNGSKTKGIGVEFTSGVVVDEVLDFTDYQYEFGQGSNGVRPFSGANAVSVGQLGWGERYDGVMTPQFDGVSRPYEAASTNRIKDFFNTGVTFNNTVAVSNGTDKGSMRASYSNMEAKGVTPNNEYSRKIFSLNLNQKLGDKLSVAVAMNYTNSVNENAPQVGLQGQGYMNFILRTSPTTPLWAYEQGATNPNGSERITTGFGGTILNPYFYIPRQFNIDRDQRLLGTVSARYQFTKWLYLQGRVAANYNFSNSESNNPTGGGGYGTANQGIYYDATLTTFNGQYNVRQASGSDMNYDFILGGNHTFGDFSVDAFFSANRRHTDGRDVNTNAQGFQTRDVYTIGNGTVFGQGSGYSQSEINSMFGSAEFGWKSIVYLNFTGRNDWFSVLTPGTGSSLVGDNSYFYPSVSGSFIFSELTEDKLTWLNYGKLRSSWAKVGNTAGINNYYGNVSYTYSTQQYLGRTIGSVSATVPNPNIKPYSLQETEIGLEARMFGSRVNVDMAVYKKVTSDQILGVTTSNASGTGSIQANAASLTNKGFEFLVDVVAVKTGAFTWTTSFNTAYNISEVLDLGPGVTRQTITDFYNNGGSNEFIGKQVYEVGKPLAQIAAKTYPRDANGNVLLNSNGRLYVAPGQPDVLFGGALPLYTGGWNNTIRYKNLSLLVHFDYKAGGKMISGSNLNSLRQGHSKASLVGRREGETGIVFPGVYVNGPNAGQVNTTSVPAQTFYGDIRGLQIADDFIYKSDYIKLRNITLTYDLTSLLSSKTRFVKGLVLSGSCRNVALIKSFVDDLDPEAVASSADARAGYEAVSLPTSRSWGLNLNVKF